MESLLVSVYVMPHAQGLPLPAYATPGSAGMDIHAAIHEPAVLQSGERLLVPTGLMIHLPEGHEAQIRSRSGLSNKYGVIVLNAPGTIDPDYRGEIQVILANMGGESFIITPGMRIAQMVIAQYASVTWSCVEGLSETTRNQSGFGSTGLS